MTALTKLKRLRHIHAELTTRGELGLAGQLYALIAEIEQRERQVERLIAASGVVRGIAIIYLDQYTALNNPNRADWLAALRKFDEAVADLQAKEAA